MKTQREQIKAAKRAYILPVGDSHSRFAVYLDAGRGLSVLWPSDSHNAPKIKDKLLYQQYSSRDRLPAYSFVLGGGGYSKTFEIARMLLDINPKLIVERINPGFNPGSPT